jgi:glycerol uptake facilitator-like aquaporin
VAVGAAVALLALIGGPLTGASMNPARSLGPAMLALKFESLWLYIAAPVAGAFIAHPFCRWIQGDECCKESLAEDTKEFEQKITK